MLKRCLERKSHRESHFTAFERALARDLTGRVYALFKVWEEGSSREKACNELGPRLLVLREDAILLSERYEGVSESRMECHDATRQAFWAPVLTMMGRSGHLSLPRARPRKWVVHDDQSMKPIDPTDLGGTCKKGRQVVAKLYCRCLGYRKDSLPVPRRLYTHNN